eukprot:g2948.t1
MKFSHSFDGRVNACNFSPDFSNFAAAGRTVLQIIQLDKEALVEHLEAARDVNETGETLSLEKQKEKPIFSLVRDFRTGRKKRNLSLSSNDVKWHPHSSSADMFATAATNGAVIIWNITKPGKSAKVLEVKHSRTANRVCWNPRNPDELLSASLQKVVKLWDVRTGAASNFRTNSECRDVAFDPFSSCFAAALENGVTQVWDVRQPIRPLKRIPSHDLVLSIDWHPHIRGKLATGGRDRIVNIWDTTTAATTEFDHLLMESSKQKGNSSSSSSSSSSGGGARLCTSVQSINTVARIRWRPDSANELASSAGVLDSNVCLWNLSQPNFPARIFKGHRDVATDLAWIPMSFLPGSGGESLSSVFSNDSKNIEVSKDDKETVSPSSGTTQFKSVTSIGDYVIQDDSPDVIESSKYPPAGLLLTCSKDSTAMLHLVQNAFRPLDHMRTTAITFSSAGELAYVCARPKRFESSNDQDSVSQKKENLEGRILHVINSVSFAEMRKIENDRNIESPPELTTTVNSKSQTERRRRCESFIPEEDIPFGFDYKRFVYCAQHYQLRLNEKYSNRNDALIDLFNVNSGVAAAAGDREISAMWLFLADLHRRDEIETEKENILQQNAASSFNLGSIACGRNAEYTSFLPPPFTSISSNKNHPVKSGKIQLRVNTNVSHDKKRFKKQVDMLEVTLKESGIPDSERSFSVGDTRGALLGLVGELDQINPERGVTAPARREKEMSKSMSDSELDFKFEDARSHNSGSFSLSSRTPSPVKREKLPLSSEEMEKMPRVVGRYLPDGTFTIQPMKKIETKKQLQQQGDERKEVKRDDHDGDDDDKSNQEAKQQDIQNQILQKEEDLSWLRDTAVQDIVEHFSERGDVQTVVILLIVMLENSRFGTSNSVSNHSSLPWETHQMQEWAMCYLELLYRLEQWTHATEVALLCGDDAIASMNSEATSISSVCAICNTSLDEGGASTGFCPSCKVPSNLCSICQLPTKGLFVWCQGCGHGGHLEHIAEWFLSQEDCKGGDVKTGFSMPCPAGCGHQCCYKI